MITIPGLESYFGGKARDGVYQTIINLQPPHEGYAEIFLGSGAIMRIKKQAIANIGMDNDTSVINYWMHAMGKPVIANPDKWWNESGCIGELNVTIIYGDAISWLEQLIDKRSLNGIPAERFLIYLDPPYVNTMRFSNTKYEFDLSDTDHERMLKIITKLRFMIQLSCYDNELYKRYLKKWNKHTFTTTDRRHNERMETLYFNYDPPTELHDWRFTGKNYRKRDNLKRKIKRHVEKFKKLPLLERKAILRQLNALSAESPIPARDPHVISGVSRGTEQTPAPLVTSADSRSTLPVMENEMDWRELY